MYALFWCRGSSNTRREAANKSTVIGGSHPSQGFLSADTDPGRPLGAARPIGLDLDDAAIARQRPVDHHPDALRRDCREAEVPPDLCLPVTLPLGTVTHPLPFQYCTSNAVIPYLLKLIASVGATGEA